MGDECEVETHVGFMWRRSDDAAKAKERETAAVARVRAAQMRETTAAEKVTAAAAMAKVTEVAAKVTAAAAMLSAWGQEIAQPVPSNDRADAEAQPDALSEARVEVRAPVARQASAAAIAVLNRRAQRSGHAPTAS